jgi:lysophospholipase L1-like esterase
MWIFYSIIGILLCILLFNLAFGYYSLEQSKKLVEYNKEQKIFTFENQGEENKTQYILLVGDSIAAGLGALDENKSLYYRLGMEFSKNSKVILENQAVSGNKVHNVTATKVQRKAYDKIIIIASSNDVFRNTPEEKFREDLIELFERYSKLSKQIVLVGPGKVYTTRGSLVWKKPFYYLRGKKYGAIVREIASKYEHVVHINPHDNLDLPEYGNIQGIDNFHPNNEGHKYWFDMTILGLKEFEK